MAGESSLLSRVSVRFATFADYKAVLAIHEDVYDGFDHLHMTYFDFLRDKNGYNFVAELDGEVVRMFNIILFTDLIISVCPYYTMCWVCFLVKFVSKNVSKT